MERSLSPPQTTMLLLVALRLTVTASAAAAPPVALPGCPEACGDIAVPYPFGIGQGCFRAGFNLTCDETHHPPKLLVGRHNEQVFDISLPGGTVSIHSRALNRSSLLAKHEYNGTWSAGLVDAGPLAVSTGYNVFVAIGCNLLARLVAKDQDGNFASICAAVCFGDHPPPSGRDSINSSTSCSGVACCQMPISQGSSSYGLALKDLDQADGAGFGAAFVVDAQWFSTNEASLVNETLYFASTDSYQLDGEVVYVTRNATAPIVPTVLEWFLETQRDSDLVFLDHVSGWRCISSNSFAFDAGDASYMARQPQGQLVRCNCTDGFQGNPYIINGCQGNGSCASISFLSIYIILLVSIIQLLVISTTNVVRTCSVVPT